MATKLPCYRLYAYMSTKHSLRVPFTAMGSHQSWYTPPFPALRYLATQFGGLLFGICYVYEWTELLMYCKYFVLVKAYVLNPIINLKLKENGGKKIHAERL